MNDHDECSHELAAENERLRAVISDENGLVQEVTKLRAEVERLRQDLDNAKMARVNATQENERLRKQVDQLAIMRGKQIPALWAENERLRKQRVERGLELERLRDLVKTHEGAEK